MRSMIPACLALAFAQSALAQFWNPFQGALTTQDNVSIGTLEPFFRLRVNGAAPGTSLSAFIDNDVESGRALVGYVTHPTSLTFGLWGQTTSNATYSSGVFGWATSPTGVTVGLRGQVESPSGRGVMGYASSLAGNPIGVWGIVDSPTGYAGYFSGQGYFSGKLGLGTEAPTEALTVNGNIALLGDRAIDAQGAGELSLRVAGQPLFRLRYDAASSTANVANGASHTIRAGVLGTIVLGGHNNQVQASYTTVGGGQSNRAGDANQLVDAATHATVGGGQGNVASAYGATVAGGTLNTASGTQSVVAGGNANIASGFQSAIAGGTDNVAQGIASFVGGGDTNTAFNLAVGGAILGGRNNAVANADAAVCAGNGNSSVGVSSIVLGGSGNNATGDRAGVLAGIGNSALGANSLAAGRGSTSTHAGSFVWSDSCDAAGAASSAADEFTLRASGGVRVFSSCAMTTGVTLASGSGSWASLSDRNAKQGIRPTDGIDVLERVAALPISTWSYTDQGPGVVHMGPMAQDFAHAFGLGSSERHIETIDADGVALAAIQGLHTLVRAQQGTIDAQAAELVSQRDTIESLARRLAALEARTDARARAAHAR